MARGKDEKTGFGAILSMIETLRGAEPRGKREAQLAQVLAGARDAQGPNEGPGKTDPEWLWGEPTDDPGTSEFGPALSEAEIAEWEERCGVSLPPTLRRAYTQQNGGMIRNQRLFLHRLEEVEPVGEGYFADLMADPPEPFDPDLTFCIGYDDVEGGTLMLAYRSPDDREPALYAYWSDGGSVAWTEDPDRALLEE